MPTGPMPARQRTVDEILRLVQAVRARWPEEVCFGHMRLESGGRVRDVLLGSRTRIDGPLTVLDWKSAPLAEVFFGCAEGDDYELEMEGGERVLSGLLLERNLLRFERGELVEIRSPGAVLLRRGADWEASRGDDESPLVGDDEPARSRPESPILVTLDPAQRRVVELRPGRAVLVLGEAGCGKTTVALHRLAWLGRQAQTDRRRRRGAVIVPTEGLRRLSRALLDRLGAGDVEVWHYDRWAAAQARHAFSDVPPRESEDATAAVIRLKRHRAVGEALAGLIAQRPGRPAARRRSARRADLLHLFGDRLLMERVVGASAAVTGQAIGATAVGEVLEHTRVQFSETTEEASRHIDADRLQTLDQRAIDAGTPMGDAGTIDVEDYAVLFEIDRRMAHDGGAAPARPRLYDWLAVDEAQEFAPLELALIGRALRPGGTLIVAGDAGQQVDPGSCFVDWKTTMADLGQPDHEAMTLDVSYRCPPEVTALARGVLGRAGGAEARHAASPTTEAGVSAARPAGETGGGEMGAAAPDAKTGATPEATPGATPEATPGATPEATPDETPEATIARPVARRRFDNECHLVAALVDALRRLRARDPLATAAVICRTPETAKRLAHVFGWALDVRLALDGDFVFAPGVQVTCVGEVKGLEFDRVILPDASAASYPATPDGRRALYVAVTRTVERLLLASVGSWSPLVQPPP